MDLHRAAAKPDWELIKPAERNAWQRLAAASGGMITLPNIVTLLGLGLIVIGVIALAYQNYWLTIIFITAGRFCDFFDGLLAEATGTKSPFGADLDAVIDKVATYLILIVLFMSDIAPVWLLACLFVPQIMISVSSLAVRTKQSQTHVSAIGKYNIALLWVSVGGLIIAKALDNAALTFTMKGLALAAILLGIYTVIDYFKTWSREGAL